MGSQFRSVQKHMGGLFNEEDVNMIAKDIMKQIFAQKAQQNEIEAKYMDDEAIQKRKERSNYQRKESIATPNIFSDKRRESQVFLDGEALKKRQQRSNYTRKESIATPNIFNDGYDPDDEAYIENMEQQFADLTDLLKEKDKEIEELKRIKAELIQSKIDLAMNSNQCLNEMRDYMIKYQQKFTSNGLQ